MQYLGVWIVLILLVSSELWCSTVLRMLSLSPQREFAQVRTSASCIEPESSWVFRLANLGMQGDNAIRLVLSGLEARHTHTNVSYPALGLHGKKSSATIRSELYQGAIQVVAAELANQSIPTSEISSIATDLTDDKVMTLASVCGVSHVCAPQLAEPVHAWSLRAHELSVDSRYRLTMYSGDPNGEFRREYYGEEIPSDGAEDDLDMVRGCHDLQGFVPS